MDNENGTESSARPLPVRAVTINQVIAWNVAWYRKAAGLTQAALGEEIGWTNAAVSEAERSWDGKRTREFDAHTIAAIAAALGVPLLALFLPPLDDGTDVRYVFTLPDSAADGGEWDMGDLMALILPDNRDGTTVMARYRSRLTFDVGRYMDAGWAKDVARWLRPLEPREIREARVKHLLEQQYVLTEAATGLGEMAAALSEDLEAEDET